MKLIQRKKSQVREKKNSPRRKISIKFSNGAEQTYNHKIRPDYIVLNLLSSSVTHDRVEKIPKTNRIGKKPRKTLRQDEKCEI